MPRIDGVTLLISSKQIQSVDLFGHITKHILIKSVSEDHVTFRLEFLQVVHDCVLSIRIPQNRKENSPLSDWEFRIIRKRHKAIFSGLCPDPPLVGEAGKQHRMLLPSRVIRVACVKGCPDASRPAYCPLTPLPLQVGALSAS